MEKLKRYNIVAPDAEDIGWDLECDENGDMIYYDDVKDLEERNKELEKRIIEIQRAWWREQGLFA